MFFQSTVVLRHTSEGHLPKSEKGPELLPSQRLSDEGCTAAGCSVVGCLQHTGDGAPSSCSSRPYTELQLRSVVFLLLKMEGETLIFAELHLLLQKGDGNWGEVRKQELRRV